MDEPMVDTTLARFQHTGLAAIVLLAAVGSSRWLLAVAVVVAGLAAVFGRRGSFMTWIYERFLRPAVEPSPIDFEAEEPHRFVLLLMTILLAAALMASTVSLDSPSRVLVWTVVVHEGAAGFGFCLGCRIHGLLST